MNTCIVLKIVSKIVRGGQSFAADFGGFQSF